MTAIVQTRDGSLQVVEGDVTVFRGIPYARVPIGDLRFRPPRAAEPWTGVRDCDTFGFAAPQPHAVRRRGPGSRSTPSTPSARALRQARDAPYDQERAYWDPRRSDGSAADG